MTRALDWHPIENKFIAANFEIRMLDDTGKELMVMEHQNPVAIILCAEWHPTGEFFVIGDYGHNWEDENIKSLLHFWSKEGSYIKAVHGSLGEYRNMRHLPLLPDGKMCWNFLILLLMHDKRSAVGGARLRAPGSDDG